MNKYTKIFVIQSLIGKKWQDEKELTDNEKFKDVRGRNYMLKLYKEHSPETEFRIVERQAINPDYRRANFYVSDCTQFDKCVVMNGHNEIHGYFDTKEDALKYINN